MNRREAFLASLAALATSALPFSLAKQPMRGWDLRNPEDLRAFKEFVSILSNRRDVKLIFERSA